MKRLLGVLALLVASGALVAGGSSAAARQATPTVSPLASLGLPDLRITATDQGFVAPAEVAAGWYLVTFDNQTQDDLPSDIWLLPAGETVESVLALDATPSAGPPPAWVYQATWAGGPQAEAGQSAQAVIQLTEGTWMVWSAGEVPPAPTSMTVTAATGAVTAPNPTAAVRVSMQEYTFLGLEQPVPAGEQVWTITNTGQQPHFMDLAKLPVGTTQQQLTEFISAEMTGTPVAGGLKEDQIVDVDGGTSTLSPGQTMWESVNLAPGTYGVACFFPDFENGAPHALLGMAVVFTVQ
jgi:hypothetical protein